MDRDDALLGSALGAALSLALAFGLTPVRDQFTGAVAALLLVLPVVLAAVVGGRTAGAVTALVSTMAFDFFFTVPYGSLTIESADDVEAAAVLLVVALVVGTVAARGRRSSHHAHARGVDVESLHRVAERVIDGAPIGDVARVAQDELVRLLSLDRCDFVPGDDCSPGLPELAHSGGVQTHYFRYVDGGFELPVGAELAVRGPNGRHGRFMLFGRPGVAVPMHRTRAAAVIADLVGTAFEADRGQQDP